MYLEASEKKAGTSMNIDIQLLEAKIEFQNTPNEPEGKKEKKNCCIS